MSDLDVKGVEAARHELHNSPWPGAISNAIRAYIAHVAASPADLRSVLAYDAGVAEGRRQALKEAALAAGRATIPEDCSPAEAHGRLTQAAASRDAVLALITEVKP